MLKNSHHINHRATRTGIPCKVQIIIFAVLVDEQNKYPKNIPAKFAVKATGKNTLRISPNKGYERYRSNNENI